MTRPETVAPWPVPYTLVGGPMMVLIKPSELEVTVPLGFAKLG